MNLKYFVILIQLLICIEVHAQNSDTLLYEGSFSLEFRFLPKYQSITDEIYRVCKLDSGLFDDLYYKFQIAKDGTTRDIKITGNLSNYSANDLKDKLSSEKLFKPANSNRTVYFSCHLKGNMNSTHPQDSVFKDIIFEPPLINNDLANMNKYVNKLLKQNFNTTQEKVKTFIQLTLKVNKPIKKLKIHKGTSHINDQIIADLVAKEVFNNEDYIYQVNRKTPRMKKSIEIVLPITAPVVKTDSIVLPYKLIYFPKYRLKRKIRYDGFNLRGNDVKSYINDSSLLEIEEVTYSYNEYNQINHIKTKYIKKDSAFTKFDSITYHKTDSVTIFNKEENRYLYKKLFNQSDVMLAINTKKEPVFTHGNYSYSVSKNDNRIVNLESKHKYTDGFKLIEEKDRSQYLYDSSGRISMIIEEGSEVKTTFTYYDDGYVETWSDGYWSDQNYYFFDDNGYLIAHINVSDTQPYVTKYEYELGWGNATLFENDSFIEPRIY